MAVTILLCYAHENERMVRQLKNHLSSLERNGLITIRDNVDISPGTEREQQINKHFDEAQIILLLISASFLASNYSYTVEMGRAIQRHESKEARVIPVILSSVDWSVPPIDKLEPLPKRGKPISMWRTHNEGYTNVTSGIKKVIEQWNSHSLSDPVVERKEMIANLDQLIETVKSQMQPPPRALATANTLQQLSVYIPNDVVLADLVVGWRTLSRASKQEEEPAISKRRETCGELAKMASQFATDQGNPAQAIKTWRIWRDVFNDRTDRGDPRQAAMASTFTRELAELQEAMH